MNKVPKLDVNSLSLVNVEKPKDQFLLFIKMANFEKKTLGACRGTGWRTSDSGR